jgi:hypothetical protein
MAGALFAVEVDAKGMPQPRVTRIPAPSLHRAGSLQTV